MKNSNWIGVAAIILIVATCYWRLIFFHSVVKWDIVDQHYPWSMFINDALRAGNLPLWNPYAYLGYPIFADPQGRVWYPVVWLISLLHGYSFAAIQLELVAHFVLAAILTYFCARTFACSVPAAICAGLTFGLSGFFVSNAQHMAWVVSAAWLPLCLLLAKRALGDGSLLSFIWCGAPFSMILLGGYPAFFFAGLVFIGVFVFLETLARFPRAFSRAVLRTVTIAASACAASAVLIVPIISTRSLISRGELSLDIVQQGSIHPIMLLSTIIPSFGLAAHQAFAFDISMTSLYCGIVALALVLYGAFQTDWDHEDWLLAVLAVLCLLFSFGKYSFVRGLAFKFVPLFDLFRFPALFRVLVVLPVAMLAAKTLERVSEAVRQGRDCGWAARRLMFFLLTLFVAALTGYIMLRPGAGESDIGRRIAEVILLEAPVQILWLGVMLLLLALLSKEKLRPEPFAFCFAVLVVFDLAHSVHGSFDQTVATSDVKLQNYLNLEQQTPRNFEHKAFDVKHTAWVAGGSNFPMIEKQFQTGGYNPFSLQRINTYLATPAAKATAARGMFFFADRVVRAGAVETEKRLNDPAYSPEHVYVVKSPRLKIKIGDRPLQASVKVSQFLPNYLKLQVEADRNAFLVIQQAFFPGWQLYIDGKPHRIFRTNLTLRGVAVPAGNHVVEMRFMPVSFIVGALVSVLFWLFACSSEIVSRLRRRKASRAIEPDERGGLH